MTRSFKIYQGEDETPVYDLTDPSSNVHVIWDEIEAGGRAFRGESTSNSIPARDERAETGNDENLPVGLTLTSLSRGSRWEWLENVGEANETRMAAGRVGAKDYSRGRQKADRAREVTIQAGDRNEELRNIIIDAWDRPEETDVDRVNALITTYLSGSPRATTNITNTYVAASNTVTMPAKLYDGIDPHGVLSEIASFANKNFFVTGDDELWYDTYDSTAYQAGIRISDRIEDINTDGECVTLDGDALYQIDFESGPDGHTVEVYPSGTGTWPNSPNTGNTSLTNTNPVGHNGSVCCSWGASFVDHGPCSPLLPATPGVTYSWNLWASSTHGGDLLEVQFWSSEGTTGTTADDVELASYVLTPSVPAAWGTWTEYSGEYTAPLGTDYMVLHAEGGWGVGVGGAYDDVTVTATGVGAGAATFPPIWDVGPASTEDGLELLSGLRLYYGQNGDYVHVTDASTEADYWHSEKSIYTSDASITDATAATALANAILTRQKYEDRTYNVSIGPLSEDQVGCIKPGQLIQIKARAIPDADDQFASRRIAQLKWTTPVPGTFFARMQLSRPIKEIPEGVGPKQAAEAITQHTTATSSHAASQVTIADAGAYFTATEVEAALQELAAGAVSDHGDLTGLLDDDHTQYTLKTLGGKEVVSTVAASGTTETIDLANGNWHDITLTDNCTFTFAGATNGVGCSFLLILRQDGTGSRTATWPASVEWPDGVTPTLSADPNAVDIFTFLSRDGGTTWYGSAGGGSAVGALDDLSDVTITTPTTADRLRYNGSAWVNSSLKWIPVTTYDGTNWLPAVDGSGNAIVTEA